MAKDDYNRIVCIILTYLYARLRGRTTEKPEAFLQPMTAAFPIEEGYFYFILSEMSRKELISGVEVLRAWGGEIVRCDISCIQITADGITYLMENAAMQTVLIWLRDHAIELPGLVTTVLSLLK